MMNNRLSHGPEKSKVMIISDAPSMESEMKGLPIGGSQLNLLKSMLMNSGIDYEQCFTTTLYPTKPPKNVFGLLYDDKQHRNPRPELKKAWNDVKTLVDNLKPNIVLLLGLDVLKAFTGYTSLKAWRGSIIKDPETSQKIIVSYHPRDILVDYSLRPISEIDLQRVKKESESPEYNIPEPEMLVLPSKDQIMEWFDAFYKSGAKRISFDIETTMSQSLLIRSIGFAYEHPQSHIYKAISICLMRSGFSMYQTQGTVINIGVDSQYSPYFTATDEARIIDLIDSVFQDSSIQKVGQNSISFDQPILEEQYKLTFKNHYFDVMHAHHLAYLELPKSLDFFTTFYTPYSNYWSNKITSDDKSNCIYNCMDCVVTLIASYAVEKELETLGLSQFYFNHIHPLAFALTRAGNRGVCFDATKAVEMKTTAEKELADINKCMKELSGKEINLASPKQLKEFLYDDRKYPIQYAKGNDSITTDAEAIKKLARKFPKDEILRLILRFREVSKLASTYLNIPVDSDRIMRTNFNASGTDTGRISSSQTLRGTGANLQNIPKSVRHLFVAREGCSFVKGDLAQAETYVVAELLAKYGDRTLVERYKNPGFDIHKWAASGIFKVDESAITDYQRQIGKLANHSGNYGAGPGVLVSQSIKRGISGIDFQFSKAILQSRHKILPGLKKWWKAVERQLQKDRTLTTCLGRKRIFFGRLDETLYRTAYAFEPQSTVGDVANIIFRELDKRLPDGSWCALQVHDEVVVECKDHLINDVIQLFREVAVIPLFINDEPRIIPIDISFGKDWKNCQEV